MSRTGVAYSQPPASLEPGLSRFRRYVTVVATYAVLVTVAPAWTLYAYGFGVLVAMLHVRSRRPDYRENRGALCLISVIAATAIIGGRDGLVAAGLFACAGLWLYGRHLRNS